MYAMDHPGLTVSNFMGNSFGTQRVNEMWYLHLPQSCSATSWTLTVLLAQHIGSIFNVTWIRLVFKDAIEVKIFFIQMKFNAICLVYFTNIYVPSFACLFQQTRSICLYSTFTHPY